MRWPGMVVPLTLWVHTLYQPRVKEGLTGVAVMKGKRVRGFGLFPGLR
jgi:hypothetical protein